MITDKRIDAYIASSASFAQPILAHIRAIVHKNCPDAQETMKWSFPHFDYKGEMLCSMASFKEHCSFGFWKASLMEDTEKIFSKEAKNGMGHLGKIQSVKDLPSAKVLGAYIKQAMKLNDEGIKVKAKKPADKAPLEVPDYFTRALSKNKAAKSFFDKSSTSFKKEYIDWIQGAKTEATRNNRMSTAIEWIAEGKHRNWKYMKK
jgi:uncharacterized protein YdeI (YjbR/CyaY-like superfamily)